MIKTLYIDADVLRYQIGSIMMKHPFLPDERIPCASDYIYECVEHLISRSLEACETKDYVCVLSGKGNFRYDIATQAPYKGNRAGAEKPFHYKTVEQYIIDNHPYIIIDGMEADDYLGIKLREAPETTCVGTRDKDIDGVEGWHYRWACGDNQPERLPRLISREEALHFFFYQMLIGDNTDNIMGCGIKKLVMWGGKEQLRRKGIGKVKALKLLGAPMEKSISELYQIVKTCYVEVFGEDEWEAPMLENARLLYIGQQPDDLFQWNWIPEIDQLPEEIIEETNDGEDERSV
ncbi:MAG: hypothetical protein ACRCTW_04480 [Lactococcus garvieae]